MELPLALAIAAISAVATLPAAPTVGQDPPDVKLSGTPQLWTVRGDVGLGRPTRYVTFQTDRGISARLLVARVSGASGRTYNADDGKRDHGRRCFRSAMNPYQRTPEPRRLKPGIAYRVQFYSRASLTGKRMLFATRTLRARSYFPQRKSGGGLTAPTRCPR